MGLSVTLLPAFDDNYLFLLIDSETQTTAVVDPGDPAVVKDYLERHHLNLHFILNTHHHWDHVGGNKALKQEYGCSVIGPSYDEKRIPCIDQTVSEGDHIQIGASNLEIWFTPGHTKGHICYLQRDPTLLFCGDTLFSLGCGRLFEGSAVEMWKNMQRIRALPEETLIYCAHEYTQSNLMFALTIDSKNPSLQRRAKVITEQRRLGHATVPFLLSDELTTNPFLRCDDPHLKNYLKNSDSSDAEVFAHLRTLKDHFR